MVRMNRGPLVRLVATCAFIAALLCIHRASTQVLSGKLEAQQLLSTRAPSVEKELKLANDYLSGHGVRKDEKQAAYWYERAAEAGDPMAQKQIGYFYEVGIGVPADPMRAVHWYQLAVAGGLASAKTNLGVAYLWGTGVSVDAQLAAQLFREAANKGDGRAATYLGNLYYSGRGLPLDKAAGEHWYVVGAKLHDPVAEFNLGAMDSVEDHPHDFAKAARWLRKSMADGYVPAMHSLALILEDHPGLAKTDRECLNLLETASGYGQWKSSEALGLIYAGGQLTPRNLEAAYYYLRLAVLQGGNAASNEKLARALQRLGSQLGSEQVARQESAAQAWYGLHPEKVELLIHDRSRTTPPGLAIANPVAGVHGGQIIDAPPTS